MKEKMVGPQGLEPGQTDYEAVELAARFDSKLKNPNEFNLAASTDPTEIEPLPNLVGVGWFTEFSKWKIQNGF